MKCIVKGCSSYSEKAGDKVSFFRFPKNWRREKQWKEQLKGNTKCAIDVKIHRICERHFQPCHFHEGLSGKKLADGAVPELFDTTEYQDVPASDNSANQPNMNLSCTGSLPPEMPSCSFWPHSTENSPKRLAPPPRKGTPLYRLLKTSPSSSDTSPRKLKRRNIALKGIIKKGKKSKKALQQKVRRLKRRVTNLEDLLKDLSRRNLLSEDEYELLSRSHIGTSVLTRFKRKTSGKKVTQTYSEDLKKFALSLHYLSPKAYSYVRSTFENCLPHPSTISRWYYKIEGDPGFCQESFNTLRHLKTTVDKRIICALSFDEMYIRRHTEFDGGKYFGYVTLGDSDSCPETVATEALVIMLVAVNGSWKLPLGYFLVAALKGEQKKNLIETCLQELFQIGIDVISLTFDGANPNISMASLLGCKISALPSPCKFNYLNNNVYVFLDPSHMIKLVRNTFGEKGPFVDSSDNIISWEYIKKLQLLQESKGLHLANKLRKAHINFFKQKMKVRLATQTLSASVADAIEHCRKTLHLSEFDGSEATVNFIRIMNSIFDILNSRSIYSKGIKKALNADNFTDTSQLVANGISYIKNLKFADGTLLIKSRNKTGFMGLIIDLENLLHMFSEFVTEKKMLVYIPSYKLSQDHLEMYFSTIRSRLGHNNNPTSRQFQSAFKRILVNVQLSDRGFGNCLPLESINILNVTSTSMLRETRAISENSNEGLEPVLDDECIDYLLEGEMFSLYTEEVIVYLAGFITRFLKQRIKCEECLTAIEGDESEYPMTLISQKNRGGLQYPSKDIVRLCRIVERYIKMPHNDTSLVNFRKTLHIASKFALDSDIFNGLVQHDFESGPIDGHRTILIKTVINKYLTIRLKYQEKSKSEYLVYLRQFFNKLTLFRGQ